MRYLIVKTSAFGDIIHAYLVLGYLKQLDPECQVDWVVEKRMSQLVSKHPNVARYIEVDTKKWRSNLFSKATWQELKQVSNLLNQETYDAVFDLQGNIKSAIITFLARAKNKIGFGFKTAPEALSAFSYNHRYNPPLGQNIRNDYLFLVESYFKKKIDVSATMQLNAKESLPNLEGYWLVCPGSNWKNKQLTQDVLATFLELCKTHYNPRFAFLCGNDLEKIQADCLAKQFPGSQVLFKPSLSGLQQIMGSLKLTLSMDSLPLHLAATAGCPTFSFFGPSSSQKYNPLGLQHGSFQGSCPYGQTFERRCSKLRTCPTGACLREVSVDVLFSSFRNWYHDS